MAIVGRRREHPQGNWSQNLSIALKTGIEILEPNIHDLEPSAPVERSRGIAGFVFVVTMTVSGRGFCEDFCGNACDIVNMQVYFRR